MQKNEQTHLNRIAHIRKEVYATLSEDGRAAKIAELENEIEYFKTCGRETMPTAVKRVASKLFLSVATIYNQLL